MGSNDCSAIPAGASCKVVVNFSPCVSRETNGKLTVKYDTGEFVEVPLMINFKQISNKTENNYPKENTTTDNKTNSKLGATNNTKSGCSCSVTDRGDPNEGIILLLFLILLRFEIFRKRKMMK